ncbi:MAG: serine hydrolase domain-containing protein [Fibrobacterota bacterium]
MSIEKIMTRAVENRMFPGAALGLLDGSRGVQTFYFGTTEYTRGEKVGKDHLFDVASITKVIPTSTLALMALDRGAFNLDDSLREILPGFQCSEGNEVRMMHLLTQTLHFTTPLSRYKDQPPEKIMQYLLSPPFASSPGERYSYCNATSILLGLAVEKIWGDSLSRLARDHIFSPLKMENSFLSEDIPRTRCLPTEVDPWRGKKIQGEIHDESAWALNHSMVPGSAGLFTSLADCMKFLSALVCDTPKPLFSEKMKAEMTEIRRDYHGQACGLGWELNPRRYAGNATSPYTLGKTGFTGCHIVADMKKGKALALLSNFTFPRRKNEVRRIDGVRRALAEEFF